MRARSIGATGAALIAALILASVISMYCALLIVLVQDESRHARFVQDQGREGYLVEGGALYARWRLQQAIANRDTANFPDPLNPPDAKQGTVTVDGQAVNWRIASTGNRYYRTEADGVRSVDDRYQIVAWLDPSTDPNRPRYFSTQRVHTVLNMSSRSIFSYAVFHDRDLEIFPGGNMTIKGRVHANRDVYLGSGADLRIDSTYLQAVGRIFRRRKDDPAVEPPHARVRSATTSLFVSWPAALDSDSQDWEAQAPVRWGGSVRSGVHGGEETAVLCGTSIDWTPGGYFRDEAARPGNGGLLILDDGNAFQVLLDGVDRTATFAALGIVARGSMYDGREGKQVPLLEIDYSKLKGDASGVAYNYWPPSGLIYAARTDGTPSNPAGVRVAEAEKLPGPPGAGPEYAHVLASGSPVYVKGPFNAEEGEVRPAAVITDAINLLSKAWTNAKTPGTLPAAGDTEFNLAFITGTVDTVGSGYSGGLENMPRLHENWSGKDLKLNGSFVALWESRIAKAPWASGGDRYQGPKRKWSYAPIYLTATSKYFPTVTQRKDVASWIE